MTDSLLDASDSANVSQRTADPLTPAASRCGAGTALDIVCLVTAVAAVLALITGSGFVLRPPIALAFALFVPGWTLVRFFGASASLLCVVSSIALSISVMMLVGESLVLFGGWRWYPVGIVLIGGTIALSVTTLRRRTGGRLPIAAGTPRLPFVTRTAVVGLGSVAIGFALVAYGAGRTTVSQTNLLGLVATLSGWSWLGVALILSGLGAGVVAGSKWAWANVAALLFTLHGLPGMVETNPRFSVAWLHTGFARQIAEHGTLLRTFDARFSWAGFFAGGGLLQRIAGTDSLLWLIRYAPVFYDAVTILLIICLARRMRLTQMQTVIAATLFVLLNWIGQDYFAPQATAFVLYLAVLTIVLCAFPANPTRMPRRLATLLRPAVDDAVGLSGRPAVLVLVGCYLVALAIVVSHQLTPGFLTMALLLLALCGAIRLRLLPVAVAVLFIVWLSYGARAYWSGHLDVLTRSVGQVGSIVKQNVGKRAQSTDLGRRLVVGGRIALAMVSWLAAGVSILVHWRRRQTPIALLCLLVAPFPMIILQPYGGEMALRVCYFTLPAVVLLVAKLVVPATARWSGRRMLLIAVPIVVLVPMFVTARFGNEAFESISDADAQLNDRMYAVVPDHATIYVESRQAPIYSQRINEVRFRSLPLGTIDDVLAAMSTTATSTPGGRPVYVMLSESQAAYGVVSSGFEEGWMTTFVDQLMQTGRFDVVARSGRGVLLHLVPA